MFRSHKFEDYRFKKNGLELDCCDFTGKLRMFGVPDIKGIIKEEGSYIGRLLKVCGKIVQYSKHVYEYNIMFKDRGAESVGVNGHVIELLPAEVVIALFIEKDGKVLYRFITASEYRDNSEWYNWMGYEPQKIIEISRLKKL
jgi:hypothetical protein